MSPAQRDAFGDFPPPLEKRRDVIGVRAGGSRDVEFRDLFVPDASMPRPQPATAVFANA